MSEIPNQAPTAAVTTAPRGAHAVDDVEFADGFATGNNAREAVDLSADPFADDLTAELEAAAPKSWHNRATVVLGALVLVVGGFLGGVQVEKHYGQTATPANARANAASPFARGGAGGTGGFGRGGGTGGTGTAGGASSAPSTAAGGTATGGTATGGTATQTNTGKITLVDGTTIYVTLASGDVLTVKTTSATKVSVGSVTKVSGLKAGQSVTVSGPTDSSGNVTATSIAAGP